MNRCRTISRTLLPGLALCAALATASAQVQTQNEAELGGRNFPVGTLRGKLLMANPPDVQLDGQAERLAPGVRIRSAQNMLVMAASLTGQKLLVNYTRDPAGLVQQIWILTPDEARAERESAEKPLLNFWPFVADTGPRDDGKTPFDQLPKFQGNQN